MPELRKDPILGRWVIIAQERGQRPTDFLIEEFKAKGGFCPLCPGNEKTTPDEVLVYGREWGNPNTPGWQLRVVPNKYPALIIEGNLDKQGEGLYDRMNGIGAHEVIIDSPNHNDRFSHLAPHQMLLTFRAFCDRIRDLAKDRRFSYVVVFKNFGRAAGASLEHSHSQLVALPILPDHVTSELNGSLDYFRYKDRCIFCDIIRQETQQNIRLVCENSHFVTLTPFAPRTPFEMCVMPRYHSSSYTDQDDASLNALAEIFSETLRRLDACIPNVPYNFVLHTQPLNSGPLEHYHWHFEIVPKLTSMAGFEWGTGFYINPMPPEETCRFLREVEL
ncbi:MAG: galactose-1-phosphate uridylyltransferase [Desulfobulbus sp.]|jgi:UDPglucose--hexose-1-phosphate uridylyltransferase|nr:galactose-1-phosphate uridylyltransferase [Desulfobulbus sp.]